MSTPSAPPYSSSSSLASPPPLAPLAPLLSVADRARLLEQSATLEPATGQVRRCTTEREANCWRHIGLLSNLYDVEKQLGVGAFGTVLKAREHATGKLYALKQLPLVAKAEMGDREMRTLRRLQDIARSCVRTVVCLHDYFIATTDIYDDGRPMQDDLYLVMDYIDGEPMSTSLQSQSLSTRKKRALFMQLLHGVAFLHSHGIAHRDLKPDNIMLRAKSSHPVIIDMGLSCFSDDDCLKAVAVGSLFYFSPERMQAVLDNRPLTRQQLIQADLWMLGLLGYYLVSDPPRDYFDIDDVLQPDKDFQNLQHIRQALRRAIPYITNKLHLPDNFYSEDPLVSSIIRSLLSINPHERGSAQAFLDLIVKDEQEKSKSKQRVQEGEETKRAKTTTQQQPPQQATTTPTTQQPPQATTTSPPTQ